MTKIHCQRWLNAWLITYPDRYAGGNRHRAFEQWDQALTFMCQLVDHR